ncbi:MAG: FAD-binding protein [Clostridia bacterium]|nr:FAD-binding protein [Clostridia bacterium]
MKKDCIELQGIKIDVYSLNTVIVGSGAAGLNAADRLYTFGQKDIALVTEGLNMGTSRNTGSDKQTYYKLTLAGETKDSVMDMAKTLYDGGSMDGDIALVEAALSPQAFYRLVDIGVPFPHNRYGEYVGYKTDHDPRQRATSAGPLTSKYMTEKLQEQVMQKGITIFDGYQVIGILTDRDKDRDSDSVKAIGLIALNLNGLEDPDRRYVLFNCTNIVYATGGPAGIYATSVYPESQTGASGIAFEAGVKGKNLTESQYGIASVKFRWNLSGTFQQVLPRYISTNRDGSDEREFLEEYFDSPGRMLDAIFLKGYQWPFDPRKVMNYGSSLIDILVYHESVVKGRRVFLDYTKNPAWGSQDGKLDFSLLGKESYEYLKNSNALFGTPIERLAHMNQPAINLYKDHGIDLYKEYLEIAVCAQHNNGGLCGNIWWESNIKHFFPVGEVNGSHGVYRPGGSALNSGQVGSIRAAQFIAARYKDEPLSLYEFLKAARDKIEEKLDLGRKFLTYLGSKSNIIQIRKEIGERMTKMGAHIRSLDSAQSGAEQARKTLAALPDMSTLSSVQDLPYAYQNWDLLVAQYVYFCAIADYIQKGGGSRGSYLIHNSTGQIPVEGLGDNFRFVLDSGVLGNVIQEVAYVGGQCIFEWRHARPIPDEEHWFENTWNAFMRDEII